MCESEKYERFFGKIKMYEGEWGRAKQRKRGAQLKVEKENNKQKLMASRNGR